MAEKALVSVIIPCFNYAHLIGDTINSIKKQTHENWECIIIDDGSTDHTKDIIQELANDDARIKYVYQKNSGPTVARNLGISLSKGNFIQFLDSDDLLEPLKLERQLSIFSDKPYADIVYGNTVYFRHTDENDLYSNLELTSTGDKSLGISGEGQDLIKEFLKKNLMVISSPLIKKELFTQFGKMDEKLFFNEDWELWLRFAVNNANFLFDDSKQAGVKIRVHQSYSKDNFKMFVNGLYVCLKYNSILTQPVYQKILQPKINYHTKTIDSKIISSLKHDVNKAKEMIEYSIKLTSLPRYHFYRKIFGRLPFFLISWISFSIAAFVKLKSLLKNGA